MMNGRRFCVWMLLTGTVASVSFARESSQTPYQFDAVVTNRAPVIDGYIEEDIWARGALVKDFLQLEPRPGEPSTERTGVRVLYDHENLYVLFICADSRPDRIVATTMAREADLNDDDNVEIFIDCLHDHRTVYYFQANAIGGRKDIFISNNGATRREEWDGIWDVACNITSKGWVAEFRIPFYNLRFSNNKEQVWGVNFNREIRRIGEESFWAPINADQGMNGMFNAALYGHMRGLHGITGQERFQFFPFMTSGVSRAYGPALRTSLREFGGDMKISLTNNLTADFTVNTDFSQIEADDEIVNLSRFELFRKEKRDFFNEQGGLFDMGDSPQVMLFYSRRIGLVEEEPVGILGGQRLTGRIGNYTVGVMNIMTEDADLEAGHEPRTLFSVIRARRDIFSRSSVGFMVTNKQAGTDAQDYNRGFGVDSRVFIGDHFGFEGALMRTVTQERLDGVWAGNAEVRFRGDGYTSSLATRHVGRHFNPEMGYIHRPDSRYYIASGSYRPRVNWGWIHELGPSGNAYYVSDTAGDMLGRQYTTNFSVLSHRGDRISAMHQWDFDHLTGNETILDGRIFLAAADYRNRRSEVGFGTDTGRTFALDAQYGWGDFWHGRQKRWDIQGRLNSLGRMIWELEYERNQLFFPQDANSMTTNLVGSRFSCSISQDMSTKLFTQFNDLDDRLLFNFLVRWTYHPGSDLYLVYNETYESTGEIDAPAFKNNWNIRARTAAAKVVYKF